MAVLEVLSVISKPIRGYGEAQHAAAICTTLSYTMSALGTYFKSLPSLIDSETGLISFLLGSKNRLNNAIQCIAHKALLLTKIDFFLHKRKSVSLLWSP